MLCLFAVPLASRQKTHRWLWASWRILASMQPREAPHCRRDLQTSPTYQPDAYTYVDQYNISLVENKDGPGKHRLPHNLRETMVSLREKMGSLSESEQATAASETFGKNSMAGWLGIINVSDSDFEKLTSVIDNCDGAAEDMAATMQDNLARQVTILKSALEKLAIQIGDARMLTICNIFSKIRDFVVKLLGVDEGNET